MARSGEEAWKEHTTPFERVQGIVLGLSKPQTPEYIAEEAAVPVETAKEHLDTFVDLAIVLKHDSCTGDQPKYGPDPLYTRFRIIRSILDSHDREGLIEIRDELRDQIETWQDEYDVDSPAMLRDDAASSERADTSSDLHWRITEWELAEYHLSIVADAIQNYDVYCRRKSHIQ